MLFPILLPSDSINIQCSPPYLSCNLIPPDTCFLRCSFADHGGFPGGKTVGVQLERKNRELGASKIKAKSGVISNASLWDTQKLIPRDALSSKWKSEAENTDMCGSFMHLHLGTPVSFSYFYSKLFDIITKLFRFKLSVSGVMVVFV